MCCSSYSVFILGAEPTLNNLSKFRGPPHFERLKTIESGDKKESVSKVIQKLNPWQEVQIMLDDDMRVLAEIANNFTIRHHEVTKKELKDDDLIEYLFYLYYGVIRLVLKKYRMRKPKE